MTKKYERGQKVSTKKDMAEIIANNKPYFHGICLRIWADEMYNCWSTEVVSDGFYYHAVEIVEPTVLGMLYVCIKDYEDDKLHEKGDLYVSPLIDKADIDKEYWHPCTIENGIVKSVVGNGL
jgi:hypothetical protein